MNELFRHFGVEDVPMAKDTHVHLRDGRVLRSWDFLNLVVADMLSGDDKPSVIYLRECHIPRHQQYSALGGVAEKVDKLPETLLGFDRRETIPFQQTFFRAFGRGLVAGELGYVRAEVTDADHEAVRGSAYYMGRNPEYSLLKFVPA